MLAEEKVKPGKTRPCGLQAGLRRDGIPGCSELPLSLATLPLEPVTLFDMLCSVEDE